MSKWEVREWRTKGCSPAGWAWASLPQELSTPGQGFRAKGQAWDDKGAKGPGS